jgi:dihydrolipoamide dehydrogenase
VEARKVSNGQKIITAINRGERREIQAREIMIASGRGPLTYLLHPEKGGIKTTEKGWVAVNEYLETSQPNVWSLGDALGKHLFKHVANYESEIVYYNAVLRQKVKADYHAIPHAVFTYPEVASVGLKEDEAVAQYGKENILIGFWKYENTAKGEAMNAKDYFVKVIVNSASHAVLGAHIIGPQASVLIQEIINVMYTKDRSAYTIQEAIHIHPAMNEVVHRAFGSLMPVEHYHEHVLGF